MSVIDEWLAEFPKVNTRRNYKVRLYKFFDETKLNEDKLKAMSIKDIHHELMVYRSERLTKGDKQNSVRTVINTVRSFLVQIDKPIKFRRGALGKSEADTDSHVFTNGDLKKLFDVGNTQEKALIATAVSLGWEVSAIIDLDRAKTASFIAHAKDNEEKFIFRDDVRDKTGEPRLAIFNPLAIETLSIYLATSKETEKLFPYTSDGINKMLNRLAKDSGLVTTGSVRFHNIRKWLMSRLDKAGFTQFQVKYIMGKAINNSDLTYLTNLKNDVEEKYPTVYEEYLNIKPNPKDNGKIAEKINDLSTTFAKNYIELKEELEKDRKTIELLKFQIGKIQVLTEFLDIIKGEEIISFFNGYKLQFPEDEDYEDLEDMKESVLDLLRKAVTEEVTQKDIDEFEKVKKALDRARDAALQQEKKRSDQQARAQIPIEQRQRDLDQLRKAIETVPSESKGAEPQHEKKQSNQKTNP